jgi:sec-independent protein translocase protein TatC
MKWPSDTSAPDGHAVKPFLEHLEDLRGTIIRCIIALVVGMAVAIPLTPWMMAWLKAPLRVVTDNPDQFLRSLEVSGAFSVSMNMALWAGILFSSPFLLLFIGGFIFPGLTGRERKSVINASGFAVALFVVGVFFAYRFTLPAALQIMFGMHTWLGIRPEWTVTSYVTFSLQLLIGFGLVFELPTVLLTLGKLGIITSLQLRTLRRHAIVIILIVAAALTPPDVFSQLLMTLPLVALYELCIWLVWLDERKKKAETTDSSPTA